jgi:ABC-type phosphate/phosphonate transport system permease subunit
MCGLGVFEHNTRAMNVIRIRGCGAIGLTVQEDLQDDEPHQTLRLHLVSPFHLESLC